MKTIALPLLLICSLTALPLSLHTASPTQEQFTCTHIQASPQTHDFVKGVAFTLGVPLAFIVAKAYWNFIRTVVLRVPRAGIVSIEGTLEDSTQTAEELFAFFQDSSIQAIVLKINSGGGTPGAAQSLYHIITELKEQYPKPIIAWVENAALSGAYYVAAAADYIVATPSALVGSIGVIASFPQLKQFFARYDVEQKIITAGTNKAATHSWHTMTDEQYAMIQELCNSTYRRFVNDVQHSRPQLAEISEDVWANGTVFDADRGKDVGLVDYLGSMVTVADLVRQYLQDDEAVIEWVYPEQPSVFKQFLQNSATQQTTLIQSLVDAAYLKFHQKVAQDMHQSLKISL